MAAAAMGMRSLLRAQIVGINSRIINDMRSTATAIEAYFADHGAYPRAIPLRSYAQNDRELIKAGGAHATAITGLTTPVTADV